MQSEVLRLCEMNNKPGDSEEKSLKRFCDINGYHMINTRFQLNEALGRHGDNVQVLRMMYKIEDKHGFPASDRYWTKIVGLWDSMTGQNLSARNINDCTQSGTEGAVGVPRLFQDR